MDTINNRKPPGPWRTLKLDTNSVDIWAKCKEILKSGDVLVSFLWLCCNTMRKSNLEEEGFIWLAVPGCSPMEQRSHNDTSMYHLIVRNRVNKCMHDSHLLVLSLISPLLYGLGMPAKGAVLPKVGYVFSHQLTKTVF